VNAANSLQALELAHEDGFSGVELNEDLLHSMVKAKPNCLGQMKDYSEDKHMINSLHKTLFRPSIDSPDQNERKHAVEYTIETLDYMEAARIYRMVLHSFSDLPAFFCSNAERANRVGYFVGSNAVKLYGILAPVLKAYRQTRKREFQENFLRSLVEIAKYAADKNVDGKPIEIVFEEHYSDTIDYESIPYGKGNLANVVRGVDTAHHLIRTGHNTDLSEISGPIHFHAVDTNGLIDDHRTIGRGKVNFANSLSTTMARKLTDTLVLEDGTRKSALKSKEVLASMIRRITTTTSSSNA
jgi:sugar phosphate isomerase/epimerase